MPVRRARTSVGAKELDVFVLGVFEKDGTVWDSWAKLCLPVCLFQIAARKEAP